MELENGFAVVEMAAKVVAAGLDSSNEIQSTMKRCVLELNTTDNDPRMAEAEDKW